MDTVKTAHGAKAPVRLRVASSSCQMLCELLTNVERKLCISWNKVAPGKEEEEEEE